jgi:hypothetical protein
VYDHSEAPWWEFTRDDDTTVVVKQWMSQAAEVFAQEIANRAAGGLARVENEGMSLDGMQGYYTCYLEFHPNHPVYFTVHRGNQTMEPKDATTQTIDGDQK